MKKKKISIIIPHYNTKSDYFKACVFSVINQTNKDYEAIIIDDGSDDKHLKDLDEFESHENIIIFRLKHSGVSSVRNFGIEKAKGEYILFLDSDDCLKPDACENVFNETEKRKGDLIVFGAELCDEKLTPFSAIENEECEIDDKEGLIHSLFCNYKQRFLNLETPWGKAYKKDFLVKNDLFFNEKLTNGEDTYFNLKCILACDRILFSSKRIYLYRFNSLSVCGNYCENLDQKFIILHNEIYQLLVEKDKKLYLKYLYFYVVRNICRLLKKFYVVNSYSQFKKNIKVFLREQTTLESLKNIKMRDLDNGKRKVFLLLKLKLYRILYRLMMRGRISR